VFIALCVSICICVCRSEKHETDDDDDVGKVFTWTGFTSAKPSPLRCPVARVCVRTVSLGGRHGSLLTVTGQLFMFGSNDHGQVGLGTDCSAVATPSTLTLPTGTYPQAVIQLTTLYGTGLSDQDRVH